MSYCRWGWDNSDVYIYGTTTVDGVDCITCCFCHLVRGTDESNLFYTYAALLEHIARHRAAGDIVPAYVDEQLREEMASEPPERWIPNA